MQRRAGSQRGTIRTTTQRFCAQSVRSAKKLVMTKSDAQRDRVLHVVIERTSLRRTLNVLNTYVQRAAKRVTIARTIQLLNAIHDAEHAAAQTTETLAASHALNTSARNAKAHWIPKGYNKNNGPEILSTICTLCEEVGHDEERCPTRSCPACGHRTHKSPTHFKYMS